MSPDEIRSALRRYRGKKSDTKFDTWEKSRKICLWDITLLAGIRFDSHYRVYRFLKGTYKFGKVVSKRLSDTIRLVDMGLVTKTQYGCYHFHDEPPVKPEMKMQVQMVAGGGIRLTGQPAKVKEKEFPDFRKVFGGK